MLTYAESPAIPGCASCKKIRSQVLCIQADWKLSFLFHVDAALRCLM